MRNVIKLRKKLPEPAKRKRGGSVCPGFFR